MCLSISKWRRLLLLFYQNPHDLTQVLATKKKTTFAMFIESMYKLQIIKKKIYKKKPSR